MKFIGQFIQHFISRFKNDVFLDDVSSGTIASGGNLGLDSNNKIVKANITDGDITSVALIADDENSAVANSGPASFNITGGAGIDTSSSGSNSITIAGETASASNAGIVELATTAETTTGTDTERAVTPDGLKDGYQGSTNVTTLGTITTGTWQGTAIASANLDSDTAHLSGTQTFSGAKTFSADVTIDDSNLTIVNSSEAEPVLTLKTTHTTANRSGELQFLKDAADTGDGERLGLISFFGEDGGGNNTKFAHMQGKIAESDDGSEGGTIELAVASHDGDMLAGLTITDGDQDAEVDVTVGGGNASVTTISGTLTMGSTATLNNSGVLQVANQPAITGVGTISSGVWRGTAIESAYLDSDTAHLSTQKHMTHHSFTADIDTTKHYVGLVDADSEATSTTGIDMPLVFPVASKLLQVTLRSNKNLSALTYTWRLETQATGVGFGTGPTIVGTQSGSGPAQTGHTTYDFTTSLDSGDNIVDAFDAVYLSLQSSGSTANTKYYITCVWETDMSGY